MNFTDNKDKMPLTPRGFIFIIVGVVVMLFGFILLSGGGVKDPQVFSYAMFDTRRLVIAPVVIVGGIVVIALAILGVFDKKQK